MLGMLVALGFNQRNHSRHCWRWRIPMKKPVAKLKLRVETLRSLTAKEQAVVIGGDNFTVSDAPECPIKPV
jgi:hypothetical protein